MANPYAYNVLTFAGASLIAQATAANPIVIVGAISRATAASSDEDLAAKDASWYTGRTGRIEAVSASANVAKIVARFDPDGARQDAKSIAVTARLASQTDADAIVLTAKSDPDATAILPGSGDTLAYVRFPFNIGINTTGSVQVTPGASASVADLARFVSLHKAGDPTRGDDQSIRGIKTFLDQLCVDFVGLPANSQRGGVVFDASIIPNEDNTYGLGMAGYAWAGVRAWEIHTSLLQNDLEDNPIDVYSSLRPSGTRSLGDVSHPWKHVFAEQIDLSNLSIYYDDNADSCVIDYSFSPSTDNAYDLGQSGKRWRYLYCAEVVSAQVSSPSRTCTLKASQSMIGEAKFICDLDSAPVCARIYTEDFDEGETADFYFNHKAFYAYSSYGEVDLGSGSNKFGAVYAIDFLGRIPTVDGTTEPEVGAIFFAGIEVSGEIANVPIGRTAKVGSPLVQGGSNITAIGAAIWDTQVGFSSYTPFSTTAGTYKLLCGATKRGSDAACFALVMRVA